MPDYASLIKNLSDSKQLIIKPENWCKNDFMVVRNGYLAYCIRGAIRCIADEVPLCNELNKDIPLDFYPEIQNECVRVAKYNNQKSHKDVLALFDKTIARLKRQSIIDNLVLATV